MEYIAQKQSDSPCTRCAKSDESLKVCYKPHAPKTDASTKGKKIKQIT
jgi:hypothetical protein